MRAFILVDLGFGDAGKGLMTDTLARETQSGLVVRYNGGAQAGHHVVTPDGQRHTFSQFGSASFLPGVKTFLSSEVIIHPGAMLVEAKALISLGVSDAFKRLMVGDQALVVTPFHQAANRIHEMARGAARHGSCGVGIGEAYEDHLDDAAESIFSRDLKNKATLTEKLGAIRERKRKLLVEKYSEQVLRGEFWAEWQFFARDEVMETWVQECGQLANLIKILDEEEADRCLREQDIVIFEGAQGVLLDADYGFHPHTTWSNCTTANAETLLKRCAPKAEVFKVGVTRCYAVRHGPGPLPTETAEFKQHISEHNTANAWQGEVRYGWFDPLLLNYALRVNGGVDALAVTHLDLLPHLKQWQFCSGYQTMEGKRMTQDLTVLSGRRPGSTGASLAEREALTRALLKVRPVLEACPKDAEEVLNKIEALARNKVAFASSGPTARTVQKRGMFF